MNEVKFLNRDVYFRVEDEHGNAIRVFSNIERLEHEFLLHAPEDEDEIHPWPEVPEDVRHGNRKGARIGQPLGQAKILYAIDPTHGNVPKIYEFHLRRYENEKTRILAEVIQILERRVGDVARYIDMTDVAWFTVFKISSKK